MKVLQDVVIGGDILTKDGYGEVVELFKNNSVLVEFPNRKRKIYFQKDFE